MEHEKDHQKVLNAFQLISDQKQDECQKCGFLSGCSEWEINRVSCSCSSFTQTITFQPLWSSIRDLPKL